MRREGFELQVGAPQKLSSDMVDGNKKHGADRATVVVCGYQKRVSGSIIREISESERVSVKNMQYWVNGVTESGIRGSNSWAPWFSAHVFIDRDQGWGYHLLFILITTMNTRVLSQKRDVGSMISGCPGGSAMAFSLFNLQDRGPILVEPATEIYEGMIIGEHLKGSDLVVNPTKNKQLTNMRASGTDEAIRLTPIRQMTLEDCLDYIGDDEYVEVTPKSLRLRKKWLTEGERKKNGSVKNG
jgi:GTP-binding protein